MFFVLYLSYNIKVKYLLIVISETSINLSTGIQSTKVDPKEVQFRQVSLYFNLRKM